MQTQRPLTITPSRVPLCNHNPPHGLPAESQPAIRERHLTSKQVAAPPLFQTVLQAVLGPPNIKRLSSLRGGLKRAGSFSHEHYPSADRVDQPEQETIGCNYDLFRSKRPLPTTVIGEFLSFIAERIRVAYIVRCGVFPRVTSLQVSCAQLIISPERIGRSLASIAIIARSKKLARRLGIAEPLLSSKR